MAGTLPPLAKPEDLLPGLGRDDFGELENARAEDVLDEVSAFVRFESRKDWLDPDDPTKLVDPLPPMIRRITIRVAERAMRNPEGFSSESAGDYSYQRNGATGEGGIYFTERELKMLRRLGGKSGLWTQQVTRGDLCGDTIFMRATGSVDWMPVGTFPGRY